MQYVKNFNSLQWKKRVKDQNFEKLKWIQYSMGINSNDNIFQLTHPLLPELGFQNVCGISRNGHPVQTCLHPLQPCFVLLSFGIVPLRIAQHRVQLCLPLHNLAICLVPMFTQFGHCNSKIIRSKIFVDITVIPTNVHNTHTTCP